MAYLGDKKDVEFIRVTSDKALDFMSLYNVLPSPSNYKIWYDYASEENMSLNQTINDMIRKRKSFSAIVCKNLYERFFENDQQQNAVATAGESIQSELVKIAKTVSDINKGSEKYSSTINSSLLGIDKLPGGTELKSIISVLLSETNDVMNSHNSAQLKLKESAKTVQKLQTTLESVRQESLTDVLTNIGNRKAFEENLKRNTVDSLNDNTDLCMIIGDIDHFKIFNDTWGHHVGDQVLKAVAHSIKTRVGDVGTTARYGGEEFVILLPHINLEKAQKIAEKIRLSIAERSMKRKSTGESIGKITCSFGVAKYRQGEHQTDFLERADSALYMSKSKGRNQVTLEDDASHKVIKIA